MHLWKGECLEGLLAGIFKAFPRQSPMALLGAGVGILLYFKIGFTLLIGISESQHLMAAAGCAFIGVFLGVQLGRLIDFIRANVKSHQSSRLKSGKHYKKKLQRLAEDRKEFLRSILIGNVSPIFRNYDDSLVWMKNELIELGVIDESRGPYSVFRAVNKRAFDEICKDPSIVGLMIVRNGNQASFQRLPPKRQSN